MNPTRQPRCQVCKHSERWRVELLRAGGASLDALAEKFSLDRDSIHRHWHNHVTDEMKASYLCGPAQLAELAEKAAAEGDSVLDYLRMIRTVLTGQLAAMTETGDARGAACVAGRLTATLETMARITGEIGALARSTININGNVAIVNSPEFARVQASLMRALAPFPDARSAVVGALRDLDANNAQAPLPARVINHVAG
ncbi:hypothetical protein [Bradyrhizobium sp. AUGA SZCCT0182]|uniref:hypothetical protein n=1 Tax=Bradyrhizobium sp. AUGA SZCCT0182 TaxID=2807667 RepID=UPI001BA63914|nr:hypothetical protein [Bradyrhizobium sp. AUGA SZCCT0182]MBR1237661.1 hypothetical protein [Bradyrhizobium sp. AUGA SZCCT0182]